MSLESTVGDLSGSIGQTELQLDSNAVMHELATKLAARDVTLTVDEVRMKTWKIILTFHNFVNKLLKMAENIVTRLLMIC